MKDKIKLIIISTLVFALDRISKILVVNKFKYLNIYTVIEDFFSITYVKNTGAAWSLFENKQLLLITISIIFLIFLIKTILKEQLNNKENLFYSLIIGGIIGNLYDRIFLNYVIDFLSFEIFGYNFPIFNLADLAIVIGTITLIISILRSEKNDRSKRRKC